MQSRMVAGAALAALVLGGGTLGYMLIEGWDFHDSLFMTVTTVTTVGYGEVHPMTRAGRSFSMMLILGGVGVVLYILSMLTQVVVEGKLREVMGRRSLERKIRSLRDHYIICGYGRIGALVADMLREQSVEMVVIESDEQVTRRLGQEGIHYVLGSATEDESLLAAGIERAKGLVATVNSDADNVYIVLTAKGIRPDLLVIARATEPGSERKLKRAGADKVVSPYFIGARRIAQTVLRPSVADFVDLTFHSTDVALLMEEVQVDAGSDLVGVSLKDSGIRQKLDLIVLAVKKPNDHMIFNPPAGTVIEKDDTLIALGSHASMQKLGQMVSGGGD
ncbi:MAG: potassium channel protein [Desulfarculus sp.]|nr:potassium channel protein [Desulfarculus sp.]